MAEKKDTEATQPKAKAKPKVEDDFDEDIISKNPDLEIAQLYFLYKHVYKTEDSSLRGWNFLSLLNRIKENEMGPFYEIVCQETNTSIDQALLRSLKEKNAKKLKEIDDEIKDAEKNLGESDVRRAWLSKSEYLSRIGSKEAAVEAFRHTFEKTVGIGYRIDLVFNLIRLGLFFMDNELISANISKAKDLIEQGGDWDRKNRLRCYEGLYKMATRDMKGAAELFLLALPTFSAYELMTYESLVFYATMTTMLSLDRPELYSKVVRCNKIQEKLTCGGKNGELVCVREFLNALYGCEYDKFYKLLTELEVKRLKLDRYLEAHQQFFTEAMRVKAYKQFLTPYKTVCLDNMAESFGVSKEFIDKELHALVSSGRLNCRIDAVNEVIEMNLTDSRNDLYKAVVRDGDILLNRVQKLARDIDS
ncbi:26S proteasome subunit RPN7 domain-containing protein [Ditylenchus destructor]|uniref:26S proteasome non-ATPase regulatory subunit 6 n=1 Tax=Ditylenchus destructor TaxID=166010 RepID=A0AAD4N921_9BILA|nr:26S proteasome subunit RPN7 domain-containing protein [Ditylenchus destructor]